LAPQIESSDRVPKITLPRMALFLEFAATLTIVLSLLNLCLGKVGQPPDSQGFLPTVFAIVTAFIAIALVIILFLMIAFLAKLHLWHSAALGWVLKRYSEDSQIESILKRTAAMPFRRAKAGLPLCLLCFAMALTSTIIVRIHFINQSINALDGLNFIGVVCAIIIVGIELMNLSNERRYGEMTYTDLKSQAERAGINHIVPEDISEQLAIEDGLSIRSRFLLAGILLVVPWCLAAYFLMQL
jgi:hypothetical protein